MKIGQKALNEFLAKIDAYLDTLPGRDVHDIDTLMNLLNLDERWRDKLSIEACDVNFKVTLKRLELTSPKISLPKHIEHLTLKGCGLENLEGNKGQITLALCHSPKPNESIKVTTNGATISIYNEYETGTSVDFMNNSATASVHSFQGAIPTLKVNSRAKCSIDLMTQTTFLIITDSKIGTLKFDDDAEIKNILTDNSDIDVFSYHNNTDAFIELKSATDSSEADSTHHAISELIINSAAAAKWSFTNYKIGNIDIYRSKGLDLAFENCEITRLARNQTEHLHDFRDVRRIKLVNTEIITLSNFPKVASKWPKLRNMTSDQLTDWHAAFEYFYRHSVNMGDADFARTYRIMSQRARRRNTGLNQPVQWLILNTYSSVSNYGYSISRPLLLLILLFYGAIFLHGLLANSMPILNEATLESAMAGVFLFYPRPIELPASQDILITIHNIASSTLLFLISLAVRSRAKI